MSDNILKSKQDANQVLRLAFDDDAQALRTVGSAATTVTVIQPDGSLLHTTVDASALPVGAATEATLNLVNVNTATISDATSPSGIAPSRYMNLAGDGGSGQADPLVTDGTGVLLTRDTLVDASTSSIDAKTPALVSGRVPVDGSGVTQPISATSLPLPTGAATQTTLAALSAKTASAAVTVPFDEQVITYVGATTNINTVVYKLAGTTVATLTLSYDGSNRLTGVVKT